MVCKPIIFKDKDGYLILKDTNRRLFKIHKLLLEFKLKRELEENEVTHHLNEDKQDNRLSNLEVKKRNQHQREHQLVKGKLSDKKKCKCGRIKGYASKMCAKCYAIKRDKIERDKLGRFKGGLK